MMKWTTYGGRCAIRMHSATGDITALRHDLRNGPCHCFSDHQKYNNSSFCKHVNEEAASKLYVQLAYNYSLISYIIDPLPFAKFPPDFIHDIESCGDRLVSKASQLIGNKTTNITENFMPIQCKMDRGKYFNRVQAGTFQH